MYAHIINVFCIFARWLIWIHVSRLETVIKRQTIEMREDSLFLQDHNPKLPWVPKTTKKNLNPQAKFVKDRR